MTNKQTKKKNKYFDMNLLLSVIFLVAYGTIMVYSASAGRSGNTYLKSQIRNVAFGFAALLVCAKFPHRFWAPLSPWLYVISFVLMCLVWTPLGISSHGARRWIQTPIGQMQPAEVVKLAVILFLPYMICKIGKKASKLRSLVIYALIGIAASAGVLLITDNLSSALIVLGITGILIFIVHPKTAPFIALISAALAVVLVGVHMLDSVMQTSGNFRIRRVLTWLHPEQYADNEGYQTLQGLYAIGSGGFFGKGLGNSTQKLILPEAQNDMIFSIVCEELGIFGMVLLLIMFGYLLYRILFIAQNASNGYGSLVASGVFAHIAIQVILNIAVVTNIIPNTGISLPFISYGGTSLMFLMIEIGIVLNISSGIKVESS